MMNCVNLVLLLVMHLMYVNTSTHWVVTEDGKLRAQPDSLLNMKRPHDLAAFVNQEQRFRRVELLKADLLKNQDLVDSVDKDDGFEENFLATEQSCIKAGKRLPDFDLYISTVLPLENKGIKVDQYINEEMDLPSSNLQEPYCNSKLDFSIYAMEHLAGVQLRADLKGTPELGLKSAITHRESADEYGHLVYEALEQDNSSWVLYNMAAFFWRIKGDATQAVECLRRALHYSPENYRDVAYVSLGNILHRARYSLEAATVLNAALDISAVLNVNHFTLGNIYAVLTEYNRSVEFFDNTLRIQPDFEAAEKRRWAVICHSKLEYALEEQHRSLQETIEELKVYQAKHDEVQKLNGKMQRESASAREKMESGFAFHDMLRERKESKASIMGESCQLRVPGDESSMSCVWKKIPPRVVTDAFLDETRFSSDPIDINKLDEVYRMVQPYPHGAPIPDLKRKTPEPDYSRPMRPPTYASKKEKKPVEKTKPLWKAKSWPSREECENLGAKPLEWDEYPTTFLPPENKGFDTRVFLAEAIDLEAREQHPLPWYPPVCGNIVALSTGQMFLDHLSAMKERDKVPLRLSDPTMRQTMLNWVNNGDVEEAEVGQRILTALKKNLAPRWLVYNLAGLYWRVAGNNYHAIECLRRSLHFVPADYLDVPLINMANILYKWNKLDDALNMTRQALIFCNYEPITHFTQANLLAAKKNDSGAVFHYEKALEFDPSFEPALEMLRNLKCYSRYHKKSAKKLKQNVCSVKSNGEDCDPNNKGKTFGQDEPESKIFSLGAFLRKRKSINPLEVEAMKDFHRSNGLCDDTDCDHIVHKPGTEPYLKVRTQGNGRWIQRLLFAAPNEDLPQDDNECLILKKGVRSSGCMADDFQKNPKELNQMESVLIELQQFIEEQEAAGELLVDDEEAFQEMERLADSGVTVDLDSFVDIVCITDEDEDYIHCFNKKDATPEEIELPEVKPRRGSRIASGRRVFDPSEKDCVDYKPFDFQLFTSTWLSVAPRGADYVNNQVTLADVAEYLDFEEAIVADEFEEPVCEARIGASVTMFDHLPSIADKEKLAYSGETVLGDIIQKLGDNSETIQVIGARISRSLSQDQTSWVLGCLSALYWRVQGHAANAINCLRMSLLYAPKESRHIPLLSLANILHKAGAISDAIEIGSAALEASPETVVIHFTLGNMYAAKGDYKRAEEYYQSTLRLQSTFEPARERLLAIICGSLLKGSKSNDGGLEAAEHKLSHLEGYNIEVGGGGEVTEYLVECEDGDGRSVMECTEDGDTVICEKNHVQSTTCHHYTQDHEEEDEYEDDYDDE